MTAVAAPRFINLTPASPPSVRRSSGAAMRGNELYTYGGFNGVTLGDLNVYDAGTNGWSVLPHPFQARERHAMDYSPLGNRVVIVGGAQGFTVTDSVYLVDGVTRVGSTPPLPGTRPAARIDATFQWAPPLNAFVLHGGRTNVILANYVQDLWTLQVADGGVTWSVTTGATAPPSGRGAACATWDTDHDLLLAFGGEIGNSSYSAETWQWAPDGGSWTNLTGVVTGDVPTPRGFCATEWEPRIRRMVLFGGNGPAGPIGGLYTFDPLTRQWRQTTAVDAPASLSDSAAAWSPELRGILVFGGRISGSTYTNETLLLQMNQAPAVDAGPDLMVGEGVLVQLSGSVVDDETPGNAIASWQQVSGVTVTLSDAGALNPTFTSPRVLSQIVLRLRLTGSDGLDLATDTVDVIVDNTINEPPITTVGGSQTVYSGDLVQLTATAFDPNGDPMTHEWAQLGVPSVQLSSTSVLTPAFVAPQVTAPTGLHFSFVTRDGVDSSAPLIARVTVLPLADAGVDAGIDAGVDAGFDAGLDAGLAGGSDAGADAGVDAGADAGDVAGARDGGAEDAGSPDAGSEDDGGTPKAFALNVGCGCSSSGPGAALLLALARLSRRRRR